MQEVKSIKIQFDDSDLEGFNSTESITTPVMYNIMDREDVIEKLNRFIEKYDSLRPQYRKATQIIDELNGRL